MGSLLGIYLRPAPGASVVGAEEARAVQGRGLEGDHARGGARQVTLLAREAWNEACAEVGTELDPSLRRANLLVEGVDLVRALGGVLRVGEVRIRLRGETTPCRLMEEARPGLLRALAPAGRGGVYGEVIGGGTLRCGDPVELEG
ncbi:MAG: MOSC domain-containing protein [Planctomycetota bacterium]|nr:MAG: MOSC domain-containing protein [Planctomycetota bacterium]